jgi:streptogramin lyase
MTIIFFFSIILAVTCSEASAPSFKIPLPTNDNWTVATSPSNHYAIPWGCYGPRAGVTSQGSTDYRYDFYAYYKDTIYSDRAGKIHITGTFKQYDALSGRFIIDHRHLKAYILSEDATQIITTYSVLDYQDSMDWLYKSFTIEGLEPNHGYKLGFGRRDDLTSDFRLTAYWENINLNYYYVKDHFRLDSTYNIDVATDTANGYIYVASWQNRVLKYDLDGNYLGDLIQTPTWGISVDNEGYVYVTHVSKNWVKKFDSSGNLVLSWTTPSNGLEAIKVADNGIVYVGWKNKICLYDTDGNYLGMWTLHRSSLIGIDVDSNNNVFVSTSGTSSSIIKLDNNGELITEYTTIGLGVGELYSLYKIAIDSKDNVHTVQYNNKLQQWSNDLDFIGHLSGCGTKPGWFEMPRGIFIDDSDNIYVVDYKRLQVLGYIGLLE